MARHEIDYAEIGQLAELARRQADHAAALHGWVRHECALGEASGPFFAVVRSPYTGACSVAEVGFQHCVAVANDLADRTDAARRAYLASERDFVSALNSIAADHGWSTYTWVEPGDSTLVPGGASATLVDSYGEPARHTSPYESLRELTLRDDFVAPADATTAPGKITAATEEAQLSAEEQAAARARGAAILTELAKLTEGAR